MRVFLLFLINFLLIIKITSALEIDLSENWTLRNTNGSISLLNLKIPLSVHNALLDAKLIEDPLYRYNDINLRWIPYEPKWYFTKHFHINETLINSTLIYIEFNTIDTIAKVYLNDQIILSTQNQFLKYSTGIINKFLNKDLNKFEIHFESPILHAESEAKKYPYQVPVVCPAKVQNGECHVNFLRKEQCSFSWDWGPALAPIGINDIIIMKAVEKLDFNFSIATYPIDDTLDYWIIDVKLNIIHNLLNDSIMTICFMIHELNYKKVLFEKKY